MSYNLTLISNNSGNSSLVGFTQVLNTEVLGGFLGLLILIAVGFIVFRGFYTASRNMSLSLIATMWINFILCFMLWVVSLISDIVMFGCLIAAAGVIAFTRGDAK